MNEQIEDILKYIEKNAAAGIKVEDLAHQFGYSKFHFSREFKKKVGISPNEYISSIKIAKSIDFILEGNSIINSLLEAGYSSSGTFSSTFKKNTGLSPKDYVNKTNELFEIVKKQEIMNEDSDSLFYRNPNYETYVAPYKLTVYLDIPPDFKGIIFSGLFLKPNPNHTPVMGRCRVKNYVYDFYHLPPGTYYPLACGIRKNKNPFKYFQLKETMRACDGQSITFPLKKNETIRIELRNKEINDPPITINLPNILSNGIKQQIKRNQKKVLRKIK